jgi:hypothetical protein
METAYECLKIVAFAIGTLLAALTLLDRAAKSPVARSALRKLNAALRMPQPYRAQMDLWWPYVVCPGLALLALVSLCLALAFHWEMVAALKAGRIQAGAALAVGTLVYALVSSGSISASLRALNAIRRPRRRKIVAG